MAALLHKYAVHLAAAMLSHAAERAQRPTANQNWTFGARRIVDPHEYG
jgi:hypothetical protein